MPHKSSIIFKLALPVPVVILVFLAVAWFVVPNLVIGNAVDAAAQSALQTAKQFKTIRGYYTKNIIAKAKANGSLKPGIEHADDPNAIPLPATLIHDLSKLLAKENTTMALYSAYPFPNRKERVMDDFMKGAWAYLNKNPDQMFKRQEVRDGKTVLRVAIADRMVAEACVNCHNSHPQTPNNDWNMGDVRGVLEIDANIGGALLAAEDLKDRILIGALLAGLAILILVILGARAISRPITQITASMRDIAGNNLDTGVPHLNRSDEIGHMAQALEVFKENALQNSRLEAEKEAQDQRTAEEHLEQKARDDALASERGRVTQALSTAMSEIAAKNLNYRITDDFPPDYQKLKVDFNDALEQLSATINRIRSSSGQILVGSREINAAADNLARRTEQQAATVAETTTAVEEAASSVSSSTGRANDASELVAKSRRDAESASDVVEQAIAAMGKIEDSADEIASITEVIDEIAFQTNLLALNAGVEAARGWRRQVRDLPSSPRKSGHWRNARQRRRRRSGS